MLVLSFFIFDSYSESTFRVVYPELCNVKYNGEFPYKNSSYELKNIASTIKKISRLVFYATHTLELEWGSFVFIIGYPLGKKMIIRDTVSRPEKISSGSFLIDATFNPGSSGRQVLAIRNSVPNFELMVMVNSCSAELRYILVPEYQTYQEVFSPHLPCQGGQYVKILKNFNHAITYSVPFDDIRVLYMRVRNDLTKEGYKNPTLES